MAQRGGWSFPGIVAEKMVKQQVGIMVAAKWIGGRQVTERTQADGKLSSASDGCMKQKL